MADEDLTILDENKPNGDTEEVAVLDDYQRETRTKLKAWAGKEHDLVTGAHIIPFSATPPGASPDGRLFYHDAARELLVASGGVWHSVAQPTFNYVINGMFSQFYTTILAPTGVNVFPGWNLYGTGAYISRHGTGSATIVYGPYVAQIISGSTEAILYQSVANNFSTNAPFAPITYWKGKTVTFGAFVYCNASSRAYIRLWDAVTSTVSAFHPGDDQWHWLTVTKAISNSAADLQMGICTSTSATTVYAGGATLVEGHSCPHPLPPSWQGRQGVLHFGSPDIQPNTNVTWFYGVSGHALGVGAMSSVPFDAYVHDLMVNACGAVGVGTFTAQVDYIGVPTSIVVSLTGSATLGGNIANTAFGARLAPDGNPGYWGVRVTRNGGNANSFFGSLLYDEVPVMPA